MLEDAWRIIMSKNNLKKKDKIKRGAATVIAIILVIAMIVPMVLSVIS